MQYLYAFIVFIIFSSIFILVYYLNSKTKKPEDCQDIENCDSCLSPCIRKENK